jgi:hypothetical protein
MKFFNIDLHVSVIEDLKTQFEALGHTIDSHLLSGHYWALNVPRASRGTGTSSVGFGTLDVNNWQKIFRDYKGAPDDWDKQLSELHTWAAAHYEELATYSGFITTYPTAFALLYHMFDKPIILHIPVRYDLGFTERPQAWREFNAWLRRRIDAGKLTAVANNRYDAFYFEHFVGRSCRVIPSTCDYIDRLTKPWSPRPGATKLLAFGEGNGCRELAKHVPDVLFVRDVLPGNYRHDEIVKALGIVWIPYTGSIMSFFEHYWLCMPLFVPSKGFLLKLWNDGLALSEQSWHKPFTPDGLKGSNIESAFKSGWSISQNQDPNTRFGVAAWMGLYDFYDTIEFPHVIYFESWDDLKEKIKTADYPSISAAMKKHNEVRKQSSRNAWQSVLDEAAG